MPIEAKLQPCNRSTFGHGPMGSSCGAKGIKLENEQERFIHKTVPLSISKKIQRARIEAGLSQKELAQKINVKARIIQMYENNKAIPIGHIIQQIEKACGCEYGHISGKVIKKSKSNIPKNNTNKRKKKKKCKLKLIKT
tara:strand:- start:226 stop:642 length:417 start_codon:yes stop_codon:yes gene_type:complete